VPKQIDEPIPCPRCGGPLAIGVRANLVIWRCRKCGHPVTTDTKVLAPDREPVH